MTAGNNSYPFQRRSFMRSDMVSFVAFYFILRVRLTAMMNITFKVKIRGVDSDDFSAHVPRFRIPADMIADLKFNTHRWWLKKHGKSMKTNYAGKQGHLTIFNIRITLYSVYL